MSKELLELQRKTIEEIEDKLTEFKRQCELAGWKKGYNDGYDTGRKDGMLEAQPKANGTWIPNVDVDTKREFLRCSNCRVNYDTDLIGKGSNYCPHCGAKMFYSMKDGD